MTDIYGATVQHTIQVSELSLPPLGFFGTRFGAEVTPQDESCAHYVEASGAFIWKKPTTQDPPMTLASVVTQEGDGNNKPFRGQDGNILYVAILFRSYEQPEFSGLSEMLFTHHW